MIKYQWLVGVVFLTIGVQRTALAKDVPVSSAAELTAAIGAAQPGHVIVLADGTYSFTAGGWGQSCLNAGTADSPIVVRAAHPLGAHIEFGTSGSVVEGFHVEGPYWHFEGLDIKGTCTDDSSCEHAFHVVGKAVGTHLLRNRITDFNAQLKVNADGAHNTPDGGLVEGNEVYDTHPRNTSNPVTKFNIDNASAWVVRANFVYDFQKVAGISFGAFHKGGSQNPVFERNLIVCSLNDKGGDTRIGLSFGGGGMASGMCPPWNGSDCNPETVGGIMSNNIIANCSDVGIYLNEAKDTKLLHNTLIGTAGIDFRFASSSGEAHGNVLSSKIRTRDSATFSGADNLMNVADADFAAWYVNPLKGDLRIKGGLTALIDKGAVTPGVTLDYCGRTRTDGKYDWGALEHSLGDCVTVPPSVVPVTDAGTPDSGSSDSSTGPDSAGPPVDGSAGSGGGTAGSGGSAGSGGLSTADSGANDGSSLGIVSNSDSSGCGCHTKGRRSSPGPLGLLLLAFLGVLRMRTLRRKSDGGKIVF